MKRSTNIFLVLNIILISVIAVSVFSGKAENRTSHMLGKDREVFFDRQSFSVFTEGLSKFLFPRDNVLFFQKNCATLWLKNFFRRTTLCYR